VLKNKRKRISNDNKVLSVYLQEIEHRILEAIYEYCTKHKYVKKDCVSMPRWNYD
jgi:transposase-like protein